MFRPSLGHLQALKKKQIHDYIDFLQNKQIFQSIKQKFISYILKYYIVRATCFDLHLVIFRTSKKTDTRLHNYFKKTHCGIPNAHSTFKTLYEHLGSYGTFFVKNLCNLVSVFFEGLMMTK